MRRRLTAALLLLAGCGFYNGYNGIYNANKLASEARRAERDGRPAEAANYWGQAAVKAESLLARQPRGKYRDDALAIRGEALASLNRCGEALTFLNEAYETATSTDVRETTSLALARCQLSLNQPDAAAATLESVVESHDANRRAEARRMRGYALLESGQYADALDEFRSTNLPSTSSAMLGALAGLGREEQVRAAFDELITLHDTTLVWDTVLSAVGRHNPPLASHMLDHLDSVGVIPPARLPALLGMDAASLQGAARQRRLEQLASVAPQSEAGDAARLELARVAVRGVGSVDELRPYPQAFRDIAGAGLSSAVAAKSLADLTGRIVATSDSTSPGSPQGDLRLFIAAERSRDSLRAPRLASDLFRRIVLEWPDGVFAPKALLAARELDPALAEATDTLLAGRYASSPYVVAARGGDRAAMRQLDDSMAAFERQVTGRGGEPGAARGRRPPANGDEPGSPKSGRTTPNKGRQVEEPQ